MGVYEGGMKRSTCSKKLQRARVSDSARRRREVTDYSAESSSWSCSRRSNAVRTAASPHSCLTMAPSVELQTSGVMDGS